MNIPSHHQRQFFDTLNKLCDSFIVYYYDEVPLSRADLGWDTNIEMRSFESRIAFENIPFDMLKDYIHILPGYGNNFLVKLRKHLCKNKFKWVHWSENASPGWKWYASYYRKFIHAQFVNKYALGALAIGASAKNDFVRWGINRSKIEILPYSFNSMPLYPQDIQIMEFKNGRKAFLFVGSLDKNKGVDILIKAFAKGFKGNPKWCLVLVGNRTKKYNYKKLVKKLSISSQVLFRGVVPSTYISSVYSATDVFILPSRYDGWGMVINEALYHQLPIIVSDAAGSSKHLVRSSVNGFIFKSGSINALTSCMLAYKNENIIISQKRKAKPVFSEFNSTAMAHHLIETLYKWEKT